MKWGAAGAVGVALVGATWVRLANLGELSFWTDEGVTWWNATHGSWRAAALAEPNHPPVWWLVTRGWLLAFPGREAALRMPAALLGVLSVALSFRFAQRLEGQRGVGSADRASTGASSFARPAPIACSRPCGRP